MNQGLKKIITIVMMMSASVLFTVNVSGADLSRQANIKEITKKVFPSVVRVEAVNGMRKVATGVVIEDQGYIVTTALVFPVGTDIWVRTSNGEKIRAEFIGMDPVTHIALVKAEGEKWKPIEWGQKQDIEAGSWISVVSISPEDRPAVTEGIVSSMDQEKIRLNVLVMPGSSGSPVVNEKGRMVGLVRGVYSGQTTFDVYRDDDVDPETSQGTLSLSIVGTPVSGLAMAIPIDVVNKVSTEIKETGKVQRGWLGISIIENQEDQVEVYDISKQSPAEKADIRKGDVILRFDGEEVTSTQKLAHSIRMHKPGDQVTMVIQRDQKEKSIQIQLSEYSKKNMIEEFREKFPLLFSPEKFRIEKFPQPKEWPFPLPKRERKYIGVYLEEINRELSAYFGVSNGTGLLVTKIVRDSPAEKAGLRVGDVIIKADGRRINTRNQVEDIIQRKEENDKVKLEVVRDKKTKNIEVQVKKEEEKFPILSHIAERKNSEDLFRKLFEMYRCIEV
ncbi:MAG: PDZ domain-containing protein [Candidatus Aminicenantes bacterium]|nr:PDZ domain-containing protein [Candidatus Aminicenantes bacterium]